MLDPRIYRATLIPVLLALIVVAFSLENRPEPARTTFAPDAFNAERAARLTAELAREFPSRRPGSAGDDALARRVAGELRAVLPVAVRARTASARTIDGTRDLVTVSATQPGSAPRAQLVLVASRDAARPGSAADLSGTAALIELARALAETRPARSITFASVSGGTGGQGGMRELARTLDRPVDAVLELADLGRSARGRSVVVGFSDRVGAAPQRLQRTVATALREETGIESRQPLARSQLARLALPLSVSGQGVALAEGLPAVRLSASGELPAPAAAPVRTAALEGYGRAALKTLVALDAGPRVPEGPERDLVIVRKVLPEWAVRLLAIALLAPALLTAVDALARLRRRREPILRWVAWVLAAVVPFLLTALFIRALGLTGAVPATAPPAAPGVVPLDGSRWVAVGCAAVVLALTFLLVRPLLSRWAVGRERPTTPGAALAPVLVIALSGLVAWVVNPYAALLLVLPANLWLLVAAGELRLPRAAAVLAVIVSLVPAALLVLSYAAQLDMAPAEIPWFWLLALAGGQVGPLALAGWSIAGGAAVAALAVALRGGGAPPGEPGPITVRGPASYAGPGSLGGTESALRR